MKLYFLIAIILISQINSLRFKSKVELMSKNKNKLQNKLKKKWQQIIPEMPRFFQFEGKQIAPGDVKKAGFMRLASDQLSNILKYPPVPQEEKKQTDVDVKLMSQAEVKALPANLQKKGSFRKSSQKDGDCPSIQFFFRLNDQNLFYTETETDSVVLGSIQVKNIVKTLPYMKQGCFKIVDKELDQWMLCSTDGKCPKEWKEAIDKAIGNPTVDECPEEAAPTELEIAPQIIIPVAAPNCKFDWNYNYHGQNWVCNCNEGLEQSPIDLPNPKSLDLAKFDAKFEYKNISASKMQVVYDTNVLRIKLEDGENFGSLTDVDGQEFSAYEIQFHTPAEHMYMGLQVDMEIQVIHRAVDGQVRKQAILSFLYRRTPGSNKPVFDLFDILNLPNPVINSVPNIMKDDLHVLNFLYDDQEIVQNPHPFPYYKYQGSNTQPPCAESVTWFVASDIQEISSTLLVMFRDCLNIPLQPSASTNINFDGGNRQVMPLNSRKVYFFDPEQACFPYKQPKVHDLPEGHYEKVTKNIQKYFWTDGFQPSGIKNALVVNANEAQYLTDTLPRVTDRYQISSK